VSYRYFRAGKNKRGWEIRFCWTTRRDREGYFKGWREVAQPMKRRKVGKVCVKRNLQAKSKHKKTMKELARNRMLAIEGVRLARRFAGIDDE